MRKAQVTAQQVARHAGVSQTTVSFVMNNVKGANISEATRERVLQAARELGYVPAAAARTLARGMSSNLAIALFNPHPQVFADPYVPNVITGFNAVVKEQGFRLLVEQIFILDDAESILGGLLRSGEVAGILVSGWQPGQRDVLHSLIHDGYALVSLDYLDGSANDIPTVALDHQVGVRSAVEHLIALGHRQIGCITYGPVHDESHDVAKRLNAYRETLKRHGITPNDAWVRYGAFDPESGYLAAQSLLASAPELTAIYGMNDLMALGAMSAIHESGRRIPQDIAVIGYDDMRFSRFTNPALTTVHAPERELGERAAEMLLGLLKGEKWNGSPRFLTPQLVVRDSCGGGRGR